MNRRRLEHTAREVLPFVETDQWDMWLFLPKPGCPACAFAHECRSVRRYSAISDFEAEVMAYYSIDAEAARWIFSAPSYGPIYHPAPAEVAERIESLLASEA